MSVQRVGRAPHDDRVLAVVLVVPRPPPRGEEAEAAVQRDAGGVRRADLQRQARVGADTVDQGAQQRRRDATSKVKKGGAVSAWVYGAENNEWITKYVNPIRTGFTSKINQPTLYQLSKLPTLGVFLATKLIYKPLNKGAKLIAKKLFYNDYLNHLGTFGWREQHNIVFDHLVAPTAFYITKTDFENWWNEIGAQETQIIWHNQNSWCGFGEI